MLFISNFMAKSYKRDVISTIFDRLRKEYPKSAVLKFNNDEVKKISGSTFSNQFDATKFDSSILLPQEVRDNGFFIVHLGQGNHAFVKGDGYHKFEKIKTIKEWKGGTSVVNQISESEAQSASTAFNDKIIHDFLSEDKKKDIKLHTARRARISYEYVVNGVPIKTDKLQIEMDGIYELEEDKTIAVVEVKNKEYEDFEIRQLFSTMKYFEKMMGWKIPNDYKIRLLFLVRIRKKKEDKFRIYEYNFTDKLNPNSIKFVKAIEYNIIKDQTHLIL